MPPLPEPRAWVATEQLRLFDNPYQGQVQVEIGGGTAVHLTGQSPERRWSFITLVDGTSGWVRTDRLRISSDPLSLGTLQLPAAPAEPFADNFESASDDWSPGGDSIRYANGKFVFHQDDCSGYLRSCHPLSFTDAEIELQVMSTGNMEVGFAFRWWNDYGYCIWLQPSGSFSIVKISDHRAFARSIAEISNSNSPHWTTWTSLYSRTIDGILLDTAPNKVRIVLLGDVIRFYANSQQVAEVSDRSYEGGSICFYAYNRVGTTCVQGEARFDNLQVKQLSEDRLLAIQTVTPEATLAGPTSTITARPRIVDPTPQPGSKCRFMHIVRPADSWYSIKHRYGVSMADIQQANQMDTSVDPQCCLNSGKEPAQILCIP
jgi:hypothetical protein